MNATTRDVWHARTPALQIRGEALIVGRYTKALSEATFESFNPATRKLLANGPSLPPLGQVSIGLKEKLFEVLTALHTDGILPVEPVRREQN